MRRDESALTPGPPGGSLDLKIRRRCFPAVLFELILDVLPFIEGAQSSALHCRDMDEHILAARLRLNESIALVELNQFTVRRAIVDLPVTIHMTLF